MAMNPVIQWNESERHEQISPSPFDDDRRRIILSSISSSSSGLVNSDIEILSNQRQIIFDKALGQMLTRHFYLTDHEFTSFDQFEGWVNTYNRHRYKIILSYYSSCSCKKFQKYYVCKHFLFVLKRIFNVDLYSYDFRLSIMQYHYFTSEELEYIFQGQIRRLWSIATPSSEISKKEKSSLVLKRQSIDQTDVCPICFERLLIRGRRLVTCFSSCGKSMHKNCMNEWKRVKGKETSCPLCQAPWIKPSATEKAVLDHYARRSYPADVHEKYVLCCLYTPPSWC